MAEDEERRPQYQAFRQRLDAVLRRRDPAALRDFLVGEGQWEPDAQTDVEAAMWMMIATSPALGALRDEARAWLLSHGHESEAQAIFGPARAGAGRASGARSGGAPRSGAPRSGAPRGGGRGAASGATGGGGAGGRDARGGRRPQQAHEHTPNRRAPNEKPQGKPGARPPRHPQP